MRHGVQTQTIVRSAGKGSRRRKAIGCKPFSDEQNDSERLPDDPVLKIENTEPGKSEQTQKGQKLIAPFHFLSCSGGL